MIKKIEIEAKSLNDAKAIAINELKVKEDQIKIELIKEKKGLFGGMNTYQASVEFDLLNLGKAYLEMIFNGLEIDFQMEARSINDEQEFYYDIDTKENSLLIGKEGRVLDAFQTLVKTYLGSFVSERIILSVDIGGYKANRMRQLEILATKVAKDVARTKIQVRLNPMSAFERRIIHAKLTEWRDVYTESEGEGEDRCLVIKPKK